MKKAARLNRSAFLDPFSQGRLDDAADVIHMPSTRITPSI